LKDEVAELAQVVVVWAMLVIPSDCQYIERLLRNFSRYDLERFGWLD